MNVGFEHLYCEECLTFSLKAMLNQGQFPAFCTSCRADGMGVAPKTGRITRPVLTFLQERGLFTKEFQYRFVSGMLRVGSDNEGPVDEREIMECPSGCGTSLYTEKPRYRFVGERCIVQLMKCPCGERFCIECKELCKSDEAHKCEAVSKNNKKAKQLKDGKDSIALASSLGKACPVCGMFIEKNEGCEWMMCGAISHGGLKDALRNGGCGIAFDWNTMQVKDDPCGYKDVDGSHLRGKLMTARQLKGYYPNCKDSKCLYLKSTDGMSSGHNFGVSPSNQCTGGGEHCCSGCASGKDHTNLCHRIPVNHYNDDEIAEQAVTDATGGCGMDEIIKYLVPFDSKYLRFQWKSHENFLSYDPLRVARIRKERGTTSTCKFYQLITMQFLSTVCKRSTWLQA